MHWLSQVALAVMLLIGCGGSAPEPTPPPPAPTPTPTAQLPAGVEQRTIVFQQRNRAYYLYVPPNGGNQALPALILHHGSGGTGLELINAWRNLAESERIILIAPRGEHGFGWMVPDDGPMMQIQIMEQLKRTLAIDARRVYLFGYSNGGDFVFYAGIQQADYFAATAIGFAALRPRQFPMLDLPRRKEPFWYTAGTEDRVYTIEEARATVAALQARTWPLEYMERAGVGHAYDPDLQNPIAWKFLKQHTLPADPVITPLSTQWLFFALR
jgi:poly(3-hydroxybutyrate) depolymerase